MAKLSKRKAKREAALAVLVMLGAARNLAAGSQIDVDESKLDELVRSASRECLKHHSGPKLPRPSLATREMAEWALEATLDYYREQSAADFH